MKKISTCPITVLSKEISSKSVKSNKFTKKTLLYAKLSKMFSNYPHFNDYFQFNNRIVKTNHLTVLTT